MHIPNLEHVLRHEAGPHLVTGAGAETNPPGRRRRLALAPAKKSPCQLFLGVGKVTFGLQVM
jgi:hypothetical protein